MAAIVLFVLIATPVISVALGALGHKNLEHSIAVGYYLVGAGALIGTLAFGLRGPTRRESIEGADRASGQFFSLGLSRGPKRRATSEERFEAKRSSLLFFAFALFLIALGAAIDPARSIV